MKPTTERGADARTEKSPRRLPLGASPSVPASSAPKRRPAGGRLSFSMREALRELYYEGGVCSEDRLARFGVRLPTLRALEARGLTRADLGSFEVATGFDTDWSLTTRGYETAAELERGA